MKFSMKKRYTQQEIQDAVDEHGTLVAAAQALGEKIANLRAYVSRYGMSIQYDRSRRKTRKSELEKYIHTLTHLSSLGWSCTRMRDALGLQIGQDQIGVLLRKKGVKRVSQGAQPGEWNVFWNDREDSEYIDTPAPSGHPYAKSNGWIKEHRLVMERHLGRYLHPEEVVHHIDGNPQNNLIENLMLFPNAQSHINYHMEILKVGYAARLSDLRAADRRYVQSLLHIETYAQELRQLSSLKQEQL